MVTPTPDNRRLLQLLTVAAVCYAVGYPVALVGHSSLGWVLVVVGGPFLFAAGFLLLRRLYLSGEEERRPKGPPG